MWKRMNGWRPVLTYLESGIGKLSWVWKMLKKKRGTVAKQMVDVTGTGQYPEMLSSKADENMFAVKVTDSHGMVGYDGYVGNFQVAAIRQRTYRGVQGSKWVILSLNNRDLYHESYDSYLAAMQKLMTLLAPEDD